MATKQKIQTLFICAHCDAQYPKWQGQCLECGQWGTVKAENRIQEKNNTQDNGVTADIVDLEQLSSKNITRLQTGINEFDRVLGGGIVPGSLILLGGDPGIGKSTLMLQLALRIPGDVLYASGEESASQVKIRLDRIDHKQSNIKFIAENQVEVIVNTIKKHKPSAVIIDSIQTVFTQDVDADAGLVNQIKASTVKFLQVAKEENIPIIVVGHVTKDGTLAGPKTLEHLVDVVLYLEGEQHHAYRIIRTVKNRFGSTAEVGIFDMQEKGLIEIQNPSKIFLNDRVVDAAGSVVTPVVEGTRTFLIEVQALVTKTVFGYPQRKSSGFDANRLQLLIAVLQERTGLKLGQYDVHMNIVGGMKVKEPSIDLAICVAIASALKNIPIQQDMLVMGEVGLSGEVRSINRMQERLKEAERMGFKQTIIPNADIKTNMKILKAQTVNEAVRYIDLKKN